MKTLFLNVLLVLFSSTGFCVDTGVLIGGGLSELKGTGDSFVVEEGGMRFGIPLKFYISDAIDIRSGFFYSLREFQRNNLSPADPDEYKMGYLEIPVLAQLKLSHWFALFAGPVYAINVTDNARTGPSTYDTEDERKRLFLGQGGIALTFGNYGIDLVYENSFTEVFTNSYTDGKWNYYGLNFVYWFGVSEDSYDTRSYR